MYKKTVIESSLRYISILLQYNRYPGSETMHQESLTVFKYLLLVQFKANDFNYSLTKYKLIF